MNEKTRPSTPVIPVCAQPLICPLNQVRAGTSVRIKQLATPPDVTHRLREMGFCEEQKIKLLHQQANVVCQVCNARFGISSQLAENILVEPLPASPEIPEVCLLKANR